MSDRVYIIPFCSNVSVSLPSRAYSAPNTGGLHSDKGDIGDLLSDIEPTVDPVSVVNGANLGLSTRCSSERSPSGVLRGRSLSLWRHTYLPTYLPDFPVDWPRYFTVNLGIQLLTDAFLRHSSTS